MKLILYTCNSCEFNQSNGECGKKDYCFTSVDHSGKRLGCIRSDYPAFLKKEEMEIHI